MNREEHYSIWADAQSPWSAWAKPILFAHLLADEAPMPTDELPALPSCITPATGETAIIVDLPGANSVLTGLALAARLRYRPVPLFNGCPGPTMVVDVGPVMRALRSGTSLLQRLALDQDAAPAFLLDARRMPDAARPQPGEFDNRWCVMAQDMPSGKRLIEAGIARVVLISDRTRDDLAHVLVRYQEAGIELMTPSDSALSPLLVSKPGYFGSLWYRIKILAGLCSNSAGGFGSVVPTPSSGSGFG